MYMYISRANERERDRERESARTRARSRTHVCEASSRCCIELQCVAVCCSVCVAVCCSVLQCVRGEHSKGASPLARCCRMPSGSDH